MVLVTTYPQGGWARYISSGRMSSRTIHLFSPLPWCLPPHILREDELATYPQGGWALEQFFVLLLLWWLSGKVIGLFLNSSLYYRLRFGMPSLWGLLPQYPQGGWARHISSVRMSSRVKHFYRESLFLLIAFAGSYFSTLFSTIIVPVHLQPVGQNVVITTISSGRMSSPHILREDELEDYSFSLHYPGACHHISSERMSSIHIFREDEL